MLEIVELLIQLSDRSWMGTTSEMAHVTSTRLDSNANFNKPEAGITQYAEGGRWPATFSMMSPSPNNQVRRSLLNSRRIDFPNLLETHPDPTYDLSVQNLTYKVVAKGNSHMKVKTLLNNVSAPVKHSEVLAIAGPSGSSKTTFLDALAGRIDGKSLKGQILVNGRPMDSTFKRVSGYVTQDDALYPTLTIRETLMFSARLRLPGKMSFREKQERVNSLIKMLSLTTCADTRVGDQKVRGVSGGERRRVSIGVDLIHDPAVLFLDEPTSGLDSTSALHVMQILSEMAILRHRTILLTIHQPSYRILDTINKFLVLSRGNVIYYGNVPQMVVYFDGLGYSMPENVSVVEYALDVIEECEDRPEGLQRLIEFQETYQQTKEMELSTLVGGPFVNSSEARVDIRKPEYGTSFFSELLVLGHRNFLVILRSKLLFFARGGLMVLMGLTVGTLFLHASRDYQGIMQRTGYFNFAIATLIFTSNEALPIFLQERQIFIRESSRGAYRASSYVLSQATTMLPFLFLLATLFSATSYFLVGLVATPTAFLTFVLIVFLTLCVANSFVSFIASVVPDDTWSQTIVLAVDAYFYLFSGLFIPRTSIPKYWIWVHYISIFKYPYEMLLKNEYGRLEKTIWFFGADSQTVLEYLGAGAVHMWINVLAMVAFVIGYRLLFYIALRFNTHNIRK